MGRQPKPYKKGNFWVTSMGGKQHVPLCRIEEGEKTARVQLARLIIEQDAMPKSLKKHMVPTVAEAHDNFLDSVKTNNRIGTFEYYGTNLRTMHEMFASRQVKDLTYDDGVAYKNKLVEMGLGRTTINMRLQSAKRLLKWVCMPSRQKQYQVFQNVFVELKLYPYQGRERLVSDTEFELVMAQLGKNGNHYAKGCGQDSVEAFRTMRGTTLRPQELRHLRWEYIRWAEHRIVFPADVIKIGSRREVTMIDSVEQLLKTRAERLKNHGNDVTKGLVFYCTEQSKDVNHCSGVMITAAQFSHKWRYAVNKCVKEETIQKIAEGGRLVPYSFRHTRITELVSEGHNIPTIMAEAGHLNPSTTMRYVHLNASQVADKIRAADQKKRDEPKPTAFEQP